MNRTEQTPTDWVYLRRELILILLWSVAILVAGTTNGLIQFRAQAVSAIAGTLVLGGWLMLKLTRKERVPWSGLEWGFLIFMGCQVLALIFSQDFRRSLPTISLYIVYILVFYLTLDWLRSGWPAELIEKTLLIVGAIVVGLALVDLLAQYLTWFDLTTGLPYAPEFNYRLYSLLGDANLLSVFVNLLIPLALARAIVSRNLVPRVLLVGLVLGGLVVGVYADSRGGMLGLAAGVGGLAVLWMGLMPGRVRETVLRVWGYLKGKPYLLVILLLLALAPVFYVGARALQFEGDATHAPILRSRTTFWSAAWEAFRSSPVVGVGPGTYPTALIAYSSMPPSRPYLHAHSLPFTFLADSGLVGILGLVALVVFIIKVGWSAWEGMDYEVQARWLAITASLAGFGVHSLADNFLPLRSMGISVMVLLAMWVYLGGKKTDVSPEPDAVNLAWLAVPAVLIATFGLYSVRGTIAHARAVDFAVEGDWADAAQEMEKAVSADPSMAFYWLESGYAYGRLAAEGDRQALETAIEHYERGIALEPEYALNHANLAALYWQAGRESDAIESLELAVQIAPQGHIFWVNLGLYRELSGDLDAALDAYRQALMLEEKPGAAAFWSGTEFRQDMEKDCGCREAAGSFDALVTEGREAIRNGDLAAAEESLQAAWQLEKQKTLLYMGLGELAIAQDDLDLAARYLRTALWLQDFSHEDKILSLLTLTEIVDLQGDHELAFGGFEQVYAAVTEYGIYGWGTEGWSPYAWFVFQRETFPVDVLPQLERADLTPEVADRLLPLVDMYLARGEDDLAMEVLERLGLALP